MDQAKTEVKEGEAAPHLVVSDAPTIKVVEETTAAMPPAVVERSEPESQTEKPEPEKTESEPTPLVISYVDIFAIIMSAISVVMITSGMLQPPANVIAEGLSLSTILILLLNFITFAFHSYYFSDVVSRIHKGRGEKSWVKFDKYATIHPIVTGLVYFLCGFIGLGALPAPIFIGAYTTWAFAGLFLVLFPALRWLYLTGALAFKASHMNTDTGAFNKKAAVAGGLATFTTLAVMFILPIFLHGGWHIPLSFMATALSFGYLRNILVASNPKVQLDNRSLPATVPVVQDGEIQINYNHFVEIQKWFKQRFALRSPWKIGVVLLIVIAAVAGNLHTGILKMFSDIMTPFLAGGGAGAAGGANAPPVLTMSGLTPTAIANQIMVFLFGMTVLTAFGGSLFAFLRAPKKLAAGKDGIKVLYGNLSGKNTMEVNWGLIKHIKVERPPGKTTAASDRLVFERYNGAPVVLKLGGIASISDREKLLGVIDRFAPDISREAAIEETLRRPMEQNYTELWLQALAAPPKREKLKPLVQSAQLNEDRYLVKKELGVGGQGFAYLAEDKRKGKDVVLKEFVLPVFVDINARRGSLENFEKEAKLLSQLDHPQVVKLEGFFVEDHRAYLVLEHIDGQNLRQIVERDGPLPEEKIRELAAQMCAILKYLHGLSPPLVHRDFTPDNLILNKDGTLKLIDFNVAQQVAYATTGTVVGKQAYLPPEQFRGQAVPASDLYAFGATLYYLAGGKDPTPISVARAIKDGLKVSEDLDSLIASLTAMEASARPADAEVVAEKLKNFAPKTETDS